MIQRIQSVWLLLAAVCSFLTLQLSFFSGNKIENNIKTFSSLTAADSFLLMILTVAVAIASLVVIFLFKDRKMQMRVAFVILVLSIVNIVLFFSETKKFTEGKHDWSSPIVFLVPIFLILAIRGIYKDQKLVKSVDRLR